MNAPARKLNLEKLVRKWWDATQVVQEVEQTISEYQDRLEEDATALNLIEDDIGRACECTDESMVFTIGGATVVLAWQEEKEYHTIELVTQEAL